MRTHWTIALSLALLAVPATGCIGLPGGDGSSEDPRLANASAPDAGSSSDVSSTASNEGGNLSQLVYPGTSPANVTVWANGSFSPQQNCYAGGCPTGSAFQQATIDEEIPDGLPVIVTASLRYEASASVFNEPLDLAMFSEEATFYSFESSEETGEDTIRAAILGGSGPLTLQVFYRWPTSTEPDATYTLEVSLAADPTLVPAGTPVAIGLGPGDEVTAVPDGDGPTSLELRGPDDARMTRVSSDEGKTRLTVPDGAKAGEHVLIVPAASQGVRLVTNGSPDAMRALPTEVTVGEPQRVMPGQTTEISFDPSIAPLSAGAYFTNTQPAAASVIEGTVTLTAPNGTLLEGEFGCTLCAGIDYYESIWAPPGDPALTPGTYTLTYEAGGQAGFSVGYFVETYTR